MEFEGLKLSAYRDAAGVVTIGYGHTWNVRMGDQISKYWARELLERDVAKVEEQIDTLGLVLTQGQTDALVDWAQSPIPNPQSRSEERRVGKECRSRWSPYH